MLTALKNKLINSKFARDSIWLMGGQFIVGTSGLLISLLIGYFYSKEDLGVFNQSLALYMLISSFSTLGLTSATVKFVADSNLDKSKIVSNHILIVGISSLILTFIVILISTYSKFLFSNNEVANAVKINSFALPFFAVNKIFISVLSGERLMNYVSFARMFRWLFLLLLIIIFSKFFKNLHDVLYSFLIVEVLLTIFLVAHYKNFLNFRAINARKIISSLRFGMFNFLAEILSYAQDKIDIIIIGYFLTKGDVGLYSLAAVFAKGLLIFSTSFMQNINPIISKLWTENKLFEIKTYFKKIFKTTFYIMTPISLFATIIFYIIIYFFLGEDFYNSFILYAIILIGTYFFSLSSWAGGVFIMVNRLDLNLIRIVFILIFTIITIILFSLYFGLYGAAFATTLKLIFSAWILLYMIKKKLSIRIFL